MRWTERPSPESGRAGVAAREWPRATGAPRVRGVLRRTLIVIAIALLAAGPAAAGTIVVTLTFVPGKLAVKAAPAVLTADTPLQVPVTLADGRGNGNGWTLRISAGHAVTVTSITARCASNSTCTLPSEAAGPAGTTVLRAARGTGMGVMNLVVTLAPLPAGAAATPVSFSAS